MSKLISKAAEEFTPEAVFYLTNSAFDYARARLHGPIHGLASGVSVRYRPSNDLGYQFELSVLLRSL